MFSIKNYNTKEGSYVFCHKRGIDMKNRNKIIYIVISIIAISFPIGFLLGVISAKVAFPIIFTLLGCQQLFHGLFLAPKDNKTLRLFSIILGILFILFVIFIVFPTYYL